MKKLTLTLSIIAAVIFTNSANAEIWRVNNNATGTNGENLGGNVSKPVFASMAAVMSSSLIPASSGDTIYLESSPNSYGAFTISKQITLIGSGTFVDQNDSTSWNSIKALTGNITVASDNVNIIGVTIGGAVLTPLNAVRNNLTIKRCYLGGFTMTTCYGSSTTLNNLVFTQNYVVYNDVFTHNACNGSESIILNNPIFTNNIFLGRLPNKNLNIVNNNVFNSAQSLTFTCNEFKNNIIRQAAQTTAISCALSAYTNNIAPTASQFPTGYNSTNLVVTESQQNNTLFVPAATNTDDGDYQLRPAYKVGTATPNNLGADGTERGVYGGAYPYTKSGIGPIPVIYKVNTNGVANQSGLNITISTKAVK
ncbi:MAG: hypothetical protein WCO37_09090 [Bacteroidota bacterium]